MKIKNLFLTFLALFALLTGCSGSDFAAGNLGKGKSSDESGNDDDDDDDDDNDDSSYPPDDLFDVDGVEPNEEIVIGDSAYDDSIIIDGESIEILKQKCWFAVSGTFVGWKVSQYADIFPNTKSGNPIGHGETFDTVGGIFLEARPEPYEYDKGDKEIDPAVNWTFDSIVVAPDMNVLIKDGSGTVLFDGEGPYIGASTYYQSHHANYYNTLKTHENLPEWMNQYVIDHDKVESLKLQTARYVKVSGSLGSKCDWD